MPYLFERYIRWYFDLFQVQFSNDNVGVSDVIAEATHFFTVVAGMIPTIIATFVNLAQVLPSNPDADLRQRAKYTFSADCILLGYLIGVLIFVLANRKVPQTRSRQPLYVLTCFVGEMYCLTYSWANGTNNEFYLAVVAVVTIAVVLNVNWPGIILLNVIYITFLVLRSYELAWGTPNHPTFYIYYEVQMDPTTSFWWYLLTNYIPFILIVLLSVYMSEALRVERNRMQRTLEIVDKSAQLMGSMKLEEARAVLQQSTDSDVYFGVVEVLRGICATLAMYRPFLPDTLLGDDEVEPETKDDEPQSNMEVRDVEDLTEHIGNSSGGPQTPPNVVPPLTFNRRASFTTSQSPAVVGKGGPASVVVPTIAPDSETATSFSTSFHERKFQTSLNSRTIVILTVHDKSHDDMTDVEGAVLFLNTVVATVKRLNGLVQSYRGGQVVATWTRTKQVSRPYVNAVRAAVSASQTLMNEHGIVTHMGIDVSPCVVGNVGTSALLMFNELRGPAVEGSLALCTLCGALDASILASEAVHKECRFACLTRKVGNTTCTDVRKSPCVLTPVGMNVFEIVDLRSSEKDKGGASEDEWMYLLQMEEKVIAEMAAFERGVNMYIDGRMEDAAAIFKAASEGNLKDKVARRYLQMCLNTA